MACEEAVMKSDSYLEKTFAEETESSCAVQMDATLQALTPNEKPNRLAAEEEASLGDAVQAPIVDTIIPTQLVPSGSSISEPGSKEALGQSPEISPALDKVENSTLLEFAEKPPALEQAAEDELVQPAKPRTAFFLYLECMRSVIVEEVGVGNANIVARRAGELWKALSPEERIPHEQRAADAKAAYETAMSTFLARGGVVAKGRKEVSEPTASAPRDPNQPVKPLSAYFCYVNHARASIAEELGTRTGSAIGRRAGELWKTLTAEERVQFEEEAAKLKASYDTAMEVFLAQGGVMAVKPKSKKAYRDAQGLKLKGPALRSAKRSEKRAEKLELRAAKRAAILEARAAKLAAKKGRLVPPRTPKRIHSENDDIELAAMDSASPKDRETPQKLKKQRVVSDRSQLGISSCIVGLDRCGAMLDDGDRMDIKVCGNARNDPSASEMAVYGSVLGQHVGYLPRKLASALASFKATNPMVRITGQACDCSRMARASDAVGLRLTLSGPPSLREALESFQKVLYHGASNEPASAEQDTVVIDK